LRGRQVGRSGRSTLDDVEPQADTSIVVASTTLEVSVAESCGLLAAVAEPVRLSILRRLADAGRCCVCDLQSETPIAANLLSYHLRVLREAGLVTAIKRGRWVDYELTLDALDRLHAALPSSGTGG
jgi:ArsR family transcriptional regulator, arsenate/arsenite/antimonite-responsive transcriptional repressor